MEDILLLFITVGFQVFEKLILRRDLVMMLKVVHHLSKVMGQTLEIHLSRDGCPPEMEVRLLVILHFSPKVGPRFIHNTLD